MRSTERHGATRYVVGGFLAMLAFFLALMFLIRGPQASDLQVFVVSAVLSVYCTVAYFLLRKVQFLRQERDRKGRG